MHLGLRHGGGHRAPQGRVRHAPAVANEEMELHGPGRALADTPAGRQEAGVQLQRGRADGDAQRRSGSRAWLATPGGAGRAWKPGGGTCTTQSLGSVTTRSLKHAASPSVSSSTSMASMLARAWSRMAGGGELQRRQAQIAQPDRQRRQADAWVIDDVWPEFARQRHGLRHRIRRRQAVAAIENRPRGRIDDACHRHPCSSKRRAARKVDECVRYRECGAENASSTTSIKGARALADERACRRVRRPAAAGAAGG